MPTDLVGRAPKTAPWKSLLIVAGGAFIVFAAAWIVILAQSSS